MWDIFLACLLCGHASIQQDGHWGVSRGLQFSSFSVFCNSSCNAGVLLAIAAHRQHARRSSVGYSGAFFHWHDSQFYIVFGECPDDFIDHFPGTVPINFLDSGTVLSKTIDSFLADVSKHWIDAGGRRFIYDWY